MPHEPLRLGDHEIVPLCDGWRPLPLDDEIPGARVDWDAERIRFPWAFPPDARDSWAWHVHAFLVRHPDGIALVDTGIGDLGRPPFDVEGRIDDELRAAVASPDRVGDVVLTHLHGDHAGATCLDDGSARFPNARYHVHPDDWAFFGERRGPGDFTGRFDMAPLDEGGRLDLDPTDRVVGPGLELVHAPGHTPGHRVVRLATRDGWLLFTGDLLHTTPQVTIPSARSTHDEDPEEGARQRERLLGLARKHGWSVCVSHFARPFGRVSAVGWVPT